MAPCQAMHLREQTFPVEQSCFVKEIFSPEVEKFLGTLKRTKCEKPSCAKHYSPENYCRDYHSESDFIRDFASYNPHLFIKKTAGMDSEGPRNFYEKFFHPEVFLTRDCKWGDACKFSICPFRHISKKDTCGERKYAEEMQSLDFGEVRPEQTGERFEKSFSLTASLKRWLSGKFGHFFLFSTAAVRGKEHNKMFAQVMKNLKKESREWNIDLLLNYLSHTIQRLLETDGIVFNGDSSQAIAHTGLVNRFGQPLLFNFKGVQDHDSRPILTRICPPCQMNEELLKVFPKPASYIQNGNDLIWNSKVEFNITENLDHIVQRYVERSGDDCMTDSDNEEESLKIQIEEHLKKLHDRTNQSPNLAILAFYREDVHAGPGHVNFFLPFEMNGRKSALAVQIVKHHDEIVRYKAATLLTIDQAYPMARVLGKPSAKWLLS
jgi:hypothetical protein